MLNWSAEGCVACGRCVRLCPMGRLTLEEGRISERERRRCIACGHCAAACPTGALTLELGPDSFTPVPENETEELILSRRSVRHFRPDPPPAEVIRRALDLVEYAPSGKNRRDHRWTVLYGREMTARAEEMALDFCARTGHAPELLKLRAAGTNLLTCDAPCVILAWSPDDALNPVADPALALALVEIQLNRVGLSTCWGGYLRQIARADREFSAFLGIPEGANLRCALMVGYAANENYVRVPPRPRAGVNWME